jgi:fluoroquinolone transport system permease protein
MQTLTLLRTLTAADSKGISRDPLLRIMALAPILLAIAVRFGLPPAIQLLDTQMGIASSVVVTQLAGYILLVLPPMLCGMLVGFLLLDQRDERSLQALRVTPLPLAHYLAYRLSMPFVLGIITSAAALLIGGVVTQPFWMILAITWAAAPFAPLTALALSTLAANKVQGLALQKLLSLPLLLPVLGNLLPAPWNLAALVAPTYWPAALLWQLQAGSHPDWVFWGLALLYQGALIGLLLRLRRE